MLAKANMLEHALAYARKGWPVFPCNPDPDPEKAKRPMVAGADRGADGKKIEKTGGLYRATTDEAQIREWWGKTPDALIGVPTGAKIGLWVLDFDPKGETVAEVEARAIEAVGELPIGPRTVTQSGGSHLWFLLPDGEMPKNSAKRLHNVDWRAEGGYVVVPPSRMRDGKSYEWEVSPDVADFPAAPSGLLDLIFKRGKFAPKSAPRAQVETTRLVTDEAKRKYCLSALARSADRVRSLVEGQRNVEINNIALGIGHLVGAGGLTRQEAYTALRDAARTLGLSDEDKALKAGGTLDRALDDGAREPADLSHVGQRTGMRRSEPHARDPRDDETPHDPDTGEVHEGGAIAPVDPDIPFGDMPHGPDGSDYGGDLPEQFPFRCLGFNRETYFYFSNNKQQITALKAAQHTPLTLLQLADLNYWSEFLGIRGKVSDEQWKQIANSLMQGCHRSGIFVESRVRGRGAWMDGDKVIVHTGDSARVQGQITPLTDIPGKFIYEAEEPWQFQFGSPASNAEAHALVDIATRLTWQDKMSGALLAGWCVIAPVCGALKWRPHVWITGPSKAGKTTAVKDIVGRIVGPAALEFDGKTSEAGIRQTMGFDALPIIVDEAESEDQAAVLRMQAILDLARVSSSGGTIAKGSQNQRAVKFVARSCFLFSSINTALKHHADESRVSRLVLARNSRPDALEHFQSLMRDINAKFTPEYAGAMFSRTVSNLPTLLANIETFKDAAAVAFRDRRAADQIGPMLAGYYLCHSTGRISMADAEAFIAKHDWADHVSLESTSDENRLFSYLMSRRIRLTVGGSPREMSVGQAVDSTRDDTSGRAYSEALGPRGIRVDFDTITISNTADGIREMLQGTPWSNDWRRPLSMIEGADKTTSAVYFAPGLTTRGVILPIGLLDE